MTCLISQAHTFQKSKMQREIFSTITLDQ